MWLESSQFYQFFTLGFCGAPEVNTFDCSAWNGIGAPETNRLRKIIDWIPHLRELGIDSVYFTPVFESDSHGYNTRDYYTVDSRLGSNEDFGAVCDSLHQNGIRIVLDAVFNHVGRGFWAFRDVQKNREASAYVDWFFIDWSTDSSYSDGFSYEGWEGHFDLVALNLSNPQVRNHLFGAVEKWVKLFRIDGLRLDVAYCLDQDFLAELRSRCNSLPDSRGDLGIILIGETIYGKDYTLISDTFLHSCTNYELYKALYSGCNDRNMFEPSWTLNRQQELYQPDRMMIFCDNHDVTRIASQLKTPDHLPLVYGLLFAFPGFPCIYYGSDWGIEGKKEHGDNDLRPWLEHPQWNGITDFIARLSRIRRDSPALQHGVFRELCVRNGQYLFERVYGEPGTDTKERMVVAVNLMETHEVIPVVREGYGTFEGLYGAFINSFTGESLNLTGEVSLPPFSILYAKQG
jgi:cyclomaltodextrinase